MVQYFIDGGPFMWPILIALIFGLGFALERAYSLVMSSINSQKFYEEIAKTLEKKSVQAAVDLCDKNAWSRCRGVSCRPYKVSSWIT